MRDVVRRLCVALAFVLLLAPTAAAEPIAVLIGTLSFDEFIPRDGPVPGTNAFNIVNYTGSNALLDPNAATELIFSDLTVTLTDDQGADSVIALAESLAPGPLLDPVTLAPLFELQFPDTALFTSARLQGVVSLSSFLLPDGRLFTADSASFTALLLPGSLFLSPLDIVGIELAGQASEATPVPEPATGVLLLTGLSLYLRSRRHRADRGH